MPLQNTRPPAIEMEGTPKLLNLAELVTFIVGKEGHENFQVHKEHACHYSPVLNAAFNSAFIEGTNSDLSA